MMKLQSLISATIALTFAAECTASDGAGPKVVSSPLPKQENMVTVGSPLYVTSAYYPMRSVVPAGPFRAGKKDFPIEYPMAVVPSSAGLKGCIVYEGNVTDRCAIDDDGDGKFDRADGKKLEVPVAFEEKELPDPRHATVQNVYLYMGATSDTLQLKYRVVTKGAFPRSFDEDMSVPLGKSFPQAIAVRDLKMTILSIDGIGLRYRIEQ